MTDGIPNNVDIGRRHRHRKLARHLQSDPNYPLYTPLKKDLRIKIATAPTTMGVRQELDPANGGVIGVAVNGVPIVHEHTGEGANTLLFDSCGGHGDLANRYHYHLPPVCLLRSLGGTVPRSGDWWLAPNAETQWPGHARSSGSKSPLVGWAIDGAPIFGPYSPDNGELVVPASSSGTDDECSTNVLDECNGMVLENGVYAYFLTPTAPFVPPCLMGQVPTEAFVDGGKLEGEDDAMCPFAGTNPLAGTEICDEKPIVFQDATCPGNAERQAIRNCFDRATASFVGEPSCEQMQASLTEAQSCFVDLGCCQDLERTIVEWQNLYPALESCSDILDPSCIEFGDDNVVALTVELDVGLVVLVPDTRALLRQSMAASLNVQASQVLLDRVTGSNETSTIVFHVAYASREEAATSEANLDLDAITADLQGAGTGIVVAGLEAEHSVPPVVPDVWSQRNKVGLGLSLAAVVVLLFMLVFLEDCLCASHDSSAEEGKELMEEEGEQMQNGEEPFKEDTDV